MAFTLRHFFFSLIVFIGLSANVRMLCLADEDPLEQEQGSTAETRKPIERCAGVDVGKGFGGWRDATQNDAEEVESIAEQVIQSLNSKEEPNSQFLLEFVRVECAFKQVVAGKKYAIQFQAVYVSRKNDIIVYSVILWQHLDGTLEIQDIKAVA